MPFHRNKRGRGGRCEVKLSSSMKSSKGSIQNKLSQNSFLTLEPPTSFVAMERYIGNMFILLISYHVNIIKNKKDVLWMEF